MNQNEVRSYFDDEIFTFFNILMFKVRDNKYKNKHGKTIVLWTIYRA